MSIKLAKKLTKLNTKLTFVDEHPFNILLWRNHVQELDYLYQLRILMVKFITV